MTPEQIDALTDEELAGLITKLGTESERRRSVQQIPVKMEQLARDYLANTGVEEEQAWRQPTGAHDAYPLGWTVKHGGKTWISLVAANVWEPGVYGWRKK